MNTQQNLTLSPNEKKIKNIKDHISEKYKEIQHFETLIEKAKNEIREYNHKLYKTCEHKNTHFEHEIYDRWTVCDDCGLTLSPYMY